MGELKKRKKKDFYFGYFNLDYAHRKQIAKYWTWLK